MSETAERQREVALNRANLTKKRLAALRNRVRSGKIDPVALILDMEGGKGVAPKLKIRALLRSVPGIGAVRADAILAECQCRPSAQLGELSPITRQRLSELVEANRRTAR